MTTELKPKFKNEEPIYQAAKLFRRIGFFLLFGAAPAFAPYYKRSIFLFTTIGAVLLALAAVIEGELNFKRLATPSISLTIIGTSSVMYVFWSGLSLTWTPFPGESGALYASFVVIVLAAALLLLFIPDRTSASHLYVLAGGVAIGWIIALGSSFAPHVDIDSRTVLRGLVTLIPLTPVVMIWFMYRRRGLLAFLLASVGLATVLSLNSIVMILALVVSLGVFLTALALPDLVRRSLSIGYVLLILLSPLIPILLLSPVTWMAGENSPFTIILTDWYRIVVDDPFRLITGHGYDTITRAAHAGLIPQTSPHGLLIDIWFELGLIGAAVFAALIYGVAMAASSMTRPSAAALLSAMTAIIVIGISGGNLPEAPWFVSIAMTAVAISALQRGQFKTARPKSGDIASLNQKKSRFSILPGWLEV